MSTGDFVQIGPEIAKAAVSAAAFTDDEGRTTIHSFVHSGGIAMGADCDLESAIEKIDSAKEIAWVDHPLKHDLAVLGPEGPCYYYDVQRP